MTNEQKRRSKLNMTRKSKAEQIIANAIYAIQALGFSAIVVHDPSGQNLACIDHEDNRIELKESRHPIISPAKVGRKPKQEQTKRRTRTCQR